MEEDLLNMCTRCGNTPCLVALMGQELVDEGNRYNSNNNVGNKQVSFRLYRMFTRKMYGVLGSDHRIPLPGCIESLIKDSFPNEDGAAFCPFNG